MKFGEFLLSKKLIETEQIEKALQIQRYCSKPLGRVLRDLGIVSESALDEMLGLYGRETNRVSVEALSRLVSNKPLSSELISLGKKHGAKVLNAEGEITAIACSHDERFVEQVECKAGQKCKLIIVPKNVFEHFDTTPTGKSASRPLIELHQSQNDDEKVSARIPYAELFRECLQTAIKKNASDIHIEPFESGAKVLLRIHGDRILWKTLGKPHRDAFISTVKQIVNLPLATLGKPADSRAKFTEFNFDVRANATRILDGDKIVLRLLDQGREFDISKCGLEANTIASLKSALDAPNGLILIAGPTGSGKTTTLYSLLSSLDRTTLNVSTIEHPVEYRLPGINQIDISETGGMAFSDALKALMRQDPDVILVGEIRDEETAELCFKAASTGHLVLSTIHASGATEIVERLRLLGIDSLSIKTSIKFAGAQRLVKKLCPHCSLPFLGKSPPFDSNAQWRQQNRVGCAQCDSGLVGRVALMEYLSSDNLKSESPTSVSQSLDKQVTQLSRHGITCVSEIAS